MDVECPYCEGSGSEEDGEQCPHCMGEGVVDEEDVE